MYADKRGYDLLLGIQRVWATRQWHHITKQHACFGSDAVVTDGTRSIFVELCFSTVGFVTVVNRLDERCSVTPMS
jgi:hypothetical protein